MIQNIFQRYEKKFLLTPSEDEALRERLIPYMQEDEYGFHTIRNIYYDTRNDELIRTSLEKPGYKEKFRVRCYGQPQEDSEVFLEIKKKYKGVVYKRRAALPAKAAMDFLKEKKRPDNPSQILREIDYFLEYYQLEPKLYLAYDRVAMYGREDPEFRITFDSGIRSRNTNLNLDCDEDTTGLLEPGCRLMEVKTAGAMPLWFVHMITDLEIRSTSFSKYGSVYKRNLIRGCYPYAGFAFGSGQTAHKTNEYDENAGRICTC